MEEELDYKKTILIVDDEKMILNLLAHNLEKVKEYLHIVNI